METKEKQKVIHQEDMEGIFNLLNSSDKDNRYIGISVLENCNYAKSLPWLLIIYKEMGNDIKTEIHETAVKLAKYFKRIMKNENFFVKFTTQQCYDQILKCENNEEPIAYLVDRFIIKLQQQMIAWDYTFLEHYKLKIEKNGNE